MEEVWGFVVFFVCLFEVVVYWDDVVGGGECWCLEFGCEFY